MKFLHTADWHIGQMFHEYDRTYEHRQFLSWLVETLQREEVDVLLISGDVFDLSNPAAASIRLFYTFLNQAIRRNPQLQIIITAGNHDSASRLESPKPLLESSQIHIVGLVEKDEHGQIDYSKLVVPLQDKEGLIQAWCLAIPFLRMGDYPAIANCEHPYAEGVAALYHEVCDYTKEHKLEAGQAMLAMGHLHAQQAEISDMDKSERLIMGGMECISAKAFPPDIQYVALGHIHKAQRIGGQEHIRYSGSPIPMSFSEINYQHQVVTFQLTAGKVHDMQTHTIPVSVPLMRVPRVHSTLPEVLEALQQLPEAKEEENVPAPYLEVRVLMEGPEPALRHKVETALLGKHVRLARIDSRYPTTDHTQPPAFISPEKLHKLKPIDVFSNIYQTRYHTNVPADILKLFQEVSQELTQAD